MKAFYLILTTAFLLVACQRASDPLIDQLEEELAKRSMYQTEKEERIERLKKELAQPGVSNEKQMFVLEELYEQYATYQFDSAMSVIDRQAQFAAVIGDKQAQYRSDLHRVMLFATAGYFTELKELLNALPIDDFSPELKVEYYRTAEWANVCMADFLDDGRFAQQYWERSSTFQDSLLRALPEESVEHVFWLASKHWASEDTESVINGFKYVYDNVEPHERLSAKAAYNLSAKYGQMGDKPKAREYLIRAAISDQRGLQKESVALQELALMLKRDGGDPERANRYLSLAVEDAMFYGNRLRLLKIAKKLPDIVVDYERQLEKANDLQNIVIMITGVLSLLLGVALVLLAINRRRLHRNRQLIMDTNNRLRVANNHSEQANQQLQQANTSLSEQTRLRESCISLFMELTAAYINKLNTFQLTVQRKVKAHQTDDLLKLINPSRMSEQDARDFFMSFDKTFLSTFPHFVDRVNALMHEDARFTLPKTNVLNLDLRILALMRLGVKDTAKIATLLNCSQQTVYNHRSIIKSRTLNKDTFDEDLIKI